MKIKNLCVMALAAVATVTTFTGCGGGSSDDGTSSGYVSAKKFAGGSVTIYSVNTRSLEVRPESKLSNSGKYTPSIVIPPSASGDDEVTYDTTDSAFCSGTIGVRSGIQYDAELLYLVAEDAGIGCVQPIITSSGYLNDCAFLNACGYLSEDDVTDSDGDLWGVSLNRFDRLVASNLGSFTIRILLNFKTQKMTLVTSGTGFTVTYFDEDNSAVMTRVIDEERRTSTITFPYIVEPR